MKKIVALVLTLVLALSLATVAFAGNTVINNYSTCVVGDKLGTATNVTVTKVPADADTYSIEHYDIDGTKYVETKTPENGDLAVISRGDTAKTVLFYLTTATNNELTGNFNRDDYTFAAYNNFSKKVACDKYTYASFDATKTYYAEYDEDGELTGNFFEVDKDGTDSVYMSGKIVMGTKFSATAGEHSWAFASFDKDGTPLTAKCNTCKTVWNVTKDFAIASAAADYYTAGVYYIYGTPVAGNSAASGVNSAKTFDAGVALYAGMALMSVAGSAVVIGKKKEF